MSEFREYVCSYVHDGCAWGITIKAKSEEDASRRLRAIGTTARVDGELVATIPAYPGVGIFVRAVAALRNFFAARSA